MARYGLLIDVAKCNGCYNCFLACKDEHCGNDHRPIAAAQPELGQYWMNVVEKERGSYPKVKVASIPMTCAQCDDPAPCMAAAEAAGVSAGHLSPQRWRDHHRPGEGSRPRRSWSSPARTVPSSGTKRVSCRRSARCAPISSTRAGRSLVASRPARRGRLRSAIGMIESVSWRASRRPEDSRICDRRSRLVVR